MITKDLKYLLIEYTIDHPKKYIKLIDSCLNYLRFIESIVDTLAKSAIGNYNYKEYYNFNSLKNVILNVSVGIDTNSSNYIKAINILKEKIEENIKHGCIDKLDWKNLSIIPSMISILDKYPDKIDWENLSYNSAAIHLLEKNQSKIDWSQLCMNPAAIDLLDKNQDKIVWIHIYRNPAIFITDKEELNILIKNYNLF